MAKRFDGKTVFITGASSGIGAAVALEFAREGARVALAARRAERLEDIGGRIAAIGGQALAVECDVRDRAGLDAAVARTVEAFGGIDVALANAGFGVGGLLENLDTDAYRRQFETNVFGVIETIYAVLPHLIRSKGRLGLVSSVAGRIASPLTSAYCASKAAVYGLAESLYYELAERGVAVTCIQPGFVESEIRHVDNKGVYHPESKDPVPKFLVVPTARAAREIVHYLYKRRFDAIITGHGRILVRLYRHCPRVVRAVTRLGTKGKLDPSRKGRAFQQL